MNAPGGLRDRRRPLREGGPEAAKLEGHPRAPAAAPESAQTSGRRRTTLLWVLALAALYFAQSLPRLGKVPRAIMDESWESCTGYALAYEGRLRNPVIKGRDGIDRAFVQPRIMQSLVLAATYRLLGVSLWAGRMASVLVGLGAVLGVFYLIRTWLSPHAAGLAALLFSVETQFFILSRTVRPEVYLVCASVWCMALLARGTSRGSMRRCFAAGVVGAVGCYTHPNMAIFAAAGVVLILYQVGLCRRMLAALGCYAAGGILGVVPFLGYVAYAQARHDVSFCEQLGTYYYTQVAEDPVGDILLREKKRWCGYLRPVYRAPWVLIVAASVVAGLLRRHPAQVWALFLLLGHLLLMPVLIRMLSCRYLVVLSPWFAVLTTVWVVQLRQGAADSGRSPAGRRVRRFLTVGSVASWLAVQVVGNAVLLHAYRNADYDAVCRRIEQNVAPGAKVCGSLVFWVGLHDHPYLCQFNEPVFTDDLAVPLLRSRIRQFAPDYIIRSSDACMTLGGLGPRPTELEHRDGRRSRSFLARRATFVDRLLERRGELLDEFVTSDFGTIEVYRIRT
ncbi:MAG TPA: glycosyltransferase family 39 protein [Phycisphaerae bacterium]|nr:glycosyltransferase family 39 protein [Phycisphaerae bacterium]